MIASPLDSASRLLDWSNVLYVGGAALTVASAMYILWENRAIASGKRVKFYLLSEFIVALAAAASLIGTIGAIHFGNLVSHIKDDELSHYQAQAKIDIANAESAAATANATARTADRKAQEARQKADSTETANAKLRIEVFKHEAEAKQANIALAAQTEKVNQFAQGVAQQQQGMAQQMQASPSIGEPQIQQLANLLRPYAGQTISVHTMMDARSQRLARQLEEAFQRAGVKIGMNMTDLGADYKGILIAVHDASPAPHPPVADALLNALHSMGIAANGVADPGMAGDGQITILIGPE
jgi:hypothetical protein